MASYERPCRDFGSSSLWSFSQQSRSWSCSYRPTSKSKRPEGNHRAASRRRSNPAERIIFQTLGEFFQRPLCSISSWKRQGWGRSARPCCSFGPSYGRPISSWRHQRKQPKDRSRTRNNIWKCFRFLGRSWEKSSSACWQSNRNLSWNSASPVICSRRTSTQAMLTANTCGPCSKNRADICRR